MLRVATVASVLTLLFGVIEIPIRRAVAIVTGTVKPEFGVAGGTLSNMTIAATAGRHA